MMCFKNIAGILLIGVIAYACKPQSKSVQTTQKSNIFPQGEKITNDNFTGTAYLQMLVAADNNNANAVGNVTFEPGARTRWHSHPAGQICCI